MIEKRIWTLSEKIIDCEVKQTEGIYKCYDCDFRSHVETELKNHTKINHIDVTEVFDEDCFNE